MAAFLTALAFAFIFHIFAFVVLLLWLLQRKWRHLLIAILSLAVGAVAGLLLPSSNTSFYVIKIDHFGLIWELSLEGVRSIIGAALGLLLAMLFVTLSSWRKVHA